MTSLVVLSALLASNPQVDAKEAARLREQARVAMFASPRIGPFLTPERVELLPVEDLLSQLKPGETASDFGLAARFRVIDKPVLISPQAQTELRQVLVNPNSYSSGVSGCAFQPTVAFRHWSSGAFVDVLVGQGCSQVAFTENARELLGYFSLTEVAASRIQVLVHKRRSKE